MLNVQNNYEEKRHTHIDTSHQLPLENLISAPSLERLYRPDPDKSIEEELYGVMDNPLPVYELLVRMYAMHAKGKVTVWVLNEVEVEYIRSALEVHRPFPHVKHQRLFK